MIKATQASARDEAGKKKRETGDPESLCQAAAQMVGYIVMVYSWLMDEMRYEVGMKKYLFVCW